MYWPADDAVTVINEVRIVSPTKEKLVSGVTCKVKERKQVHEGKVLGIGKSHLRITKLSSVLMFITV